MKLTQRGTLGLAIMAGAIATAGGIQNGLATVIASDNAGNSPYVINNSFGGQNGGTGFGAWSVTNNTGGNLINSVTWSGTTPWFDIYNTSTNTSPYSGGDQTTATRSINSALVAGDTLSFSFVLNNSQTNSTVGFWLGDSSNAGLITFYQHGFDPTTGYLTDASGTTNGIGVPYNYQSVDNVAITLTSSTAYNLYVNSSLVHSGTISGSIANPDIS